MKRRRDETKDGRVLGAAEKTAAIDLLGARLPMAVLSKIFGYLALGDHRRLSRTSQLCAKVAKQKTSSPHTIVLGGDVSRGVWPSFVNFCPVQLVVTTNLYRHQQWWIDTICGMNRSLQILHFKVTPHDLTDWTSIVRALRYLIDFETGDGLMLSVVPLAHHLPHLTSLSACTTASTLDNPTDQKFRPSRLFDSDEISH
jgi:hypothetical protein